MKELRFTLADGEWRIAFAFDPERSAILLVGGSKSGVSEKRFYKDLIRVADERFTRAPENAIIEERRNKMTVTLEEFTKDFTPEERAQVAARTAELIEEELTLRDLRQAQQLTQERMAELMGVEQENVSRLERRANLLLSTLSSYVAAMGGKLRLIAEFPDRHPVAIALADITGKDKPKPRPRRPRAKEQAPAGESAASAPLSGRRLGFAKLRAREERLDPPLQSRLF